jgi:PST family polysaccharide transporter
MKMRTQLAQNSLWLLAARIGTQALTVLFTVLLARRLGIDGFGEYAFVAAVIILGNTLTSFGTDMLLIREIAGRGDFSRLPAALLLQLMLSSLFVALVWLVVPLLPNQSPAAVLALRVYSLALFPLAFFTIFTAALRGRERMVAYTLLNLSVAALQVAGLWVFRDAVTNVIALAVLLLIVQVLAAVLAGVLCTAQIDGFWQPRHLSWQAIPEVLRSAGPIAALGLLGMLYQKLGLYLLATLSGVAVTGWFSAAQRAVEASKTVHLAVFTALYPGMARAETDSTRQTGWAEALRFSWKILLAGAVLAALALSLLAAPLVRLLYGAEFEPAVPVLRILVWTLIPYTANTFLTLSFVAAQKERAVGWALTAGLFGLASMCLWWIPVTGAVGVAWAVLIAECIQAAVLLAHGQVFLSLYILKQGKPHELSKLS